jgi:hypothetical protein
MSRAIHVFAWLLAGASTLFTPRAHACGVSGADGAWSCSVEEHEEAERPRWSVGVAGLSTWTTLRFGDALCAKQTRNAIVTTGAYAPIRRLSIQVSAGMAFGGELRAPNGTHEFSVGPTVAAGVVYTFIEGRPFVAISGLLSATHATTSLPGRPTQDADYSAFDLRAGVIAGTTVFEILSPYLVARVFGGPVFWRYERQDQTGTDTSHVQLGAGVTLRALEWIALYIEGIPLGERALSGGVSFAF